MGIIRGLGKVVIGIGAATAVVAALPILGPVGAVSAAGAAVAASVGAAAGVADEIIETKKEWKKKS